MRPLTVFIGANGSGKSNLFEVLENVPKQRVSHALDQATHDCGKKKYSKGRLSFQILEAIDPALVEAAYPAAKALLDRLRTA